MRLRPLDLINFHLFKVTMAGRIHIRSLRFKQTVYLSREENEYWYDDAVEFLQKADFNITGMCEGEGCMYIISDTFKPF